MRLFFHILTPNPITRTFFTLWERRLCDLIQKSPKSIRDSSPVSPTVPTDLIIMANTKVFSIVDSRSLGVYYRNIFALTLVKLCVCAFALYLEECGRSVLSSSLFLVCPFNYFSSFTLFWASQIKSNYIFIHFIRSVHVKKKIEKNSPRLEVTRTMAA